MKRMTPAEQRAVWEQRLERYSAWERTVATSAKLKEYRPQRFIDGKAAWARGEVRARRLTESCPANPRNEDRWSTLRHRIVVPQQQRTCGDVVTGQLNGNHPITDLRARAAFLSWRT